MKIKSLSLLLFLFTLFACDTSRETSKEIDPNEYWGKSPWPEIRKKRINELLPSALERAGRHLDR